MMHCAGMLLILQLSSAGAVSADDDERRIEALIAAERLLQTPAAAAGPHAAPSNAPVAPAGVATASAGITRAEAAAAPMASATVAAVPMDLQQPAVPAMPVENDSGELRFDDLRKHVGETLHITTTTGSRRTARVESADSRQVTLLVSQPGGTATYTLKRGQIAGIEPP